MFIKPRSYIFNFGKYNGKKFADIKKVDLEYVWWCHQTLTQFTLAPRLAKEIRTELGKQRFLNRMDERDHDYYDEDRFQSDDYYY